MFFTIILQVYLAAFSVHLLYQVLNGVCIRLARVWMILSEHASVGVW